MGFIRNALKAFFNSTKPGLGFSAEDVKKIVIGALVNAFGVALIAIIEQIAKLDWGLWSPICTGIAIVAVNIIRKWLPGLEQK